MDTLHHQNNHSGLLVIEAGAKSIVVPRVCSSADSLGYTALWLDRVVDDDVAAASTGQRAADRSGEPPAAARRLKVADRRTFF